MISKVAVVASAGCATHTRTVSTGDPYARDDVVLTSAPGTVVYTSPAIPSALATQPCDHGWFDHAAGVCDVKGD